MLLRAGKSKTFAFESHHIDCFVPSFIIFFGVFDLTRCRAFARSENVNMQSIAWLRLV